MTLISLQLFSLSSTDGMLLRHLLVIRVGLAMKDGIETDLPIDGSHAFLVGDGNTAGSENNVHLLECQALRQQVSITNV